MSCLRPWRVTVLALLAVMIPLAVIVAAISLWPPGPPPRPHVIYLEVS